MRGLRWYIVGLLCLASALNYLDRQSLSVLAQTIQDELHISTVQYSYITTAFLLSYTVAYAASGRLVDRLGTRRSLLYFVSGWSLANMLHAFARTTLQFSVVRVLLGAAEPANFPAGIKAVTEWFPMRERSLAAGIFNSGTAVGAALAAPVVSLLALTWGWRCAFVAGGALGFVWVAAWAWAYRSPADHPWLTAEERNLIEDGRPPPRAAGPAVPLGRILRMRRVWGCISARLMYDPIAYFFIFWTPKFLQQERGFNLAEIGKYSGVPFAFWALGNITGGAVPPCLIRRGWSLHRSRRTVMAAASCAIPVCCLLITRVPGAALAVAAISAALFCLGAWGAITLPAEVFPGHLVGVVTGLGGAGGAFLGAVSQYAIGWTVQNISFAPVFAVCAFLPLVAFAVTGALLGELGTLDPEPA